MASPIQPLKLGSLSLEHNLIQAPLAGYSNAAFRSIAHRYGQPAYACTEMISAQTICDQGHKAAFYLQRHADEGLLCYQISGTDADSLGQACARLTHLGADLIDLNCGCPVKKIRRRGAGSKLIEQPKKLQQLISAMRHQTHLPLSIKIRVAGDEDTQIGLQAALAAESAGADFITVHGRHWGDDYQQAVRLERIARICEQVNIPVIGNGDVSDANSLRLLFTETGCAGAMIARASTGQPWIFAQLRAALNHETYHPPSVAEIGQIYLEHVQQLCTLMGETKALLHARALGKYYARKQNHAADFYCDLTRLRTLTELTSLVQQYF